jgi:hypothetical protein
MTPNRMITETILQQLGGSRFAVMTGAKHFCELERGLGFQIPGNITKDGINSVKITLEWSDTYTVKFMRMTRTKLVTVSEVKDVYCDTLQETFTEATGLDTHL